MAIRVVARIRPRHDKERDQDVIVSAAGVDDDQADQTIVKIPSPKDANSDFSFQFSRVYDEVATQQLIFDNEGGYRRFDG